MSSPQSRGINPPIVDPIKIPIQIGDRMVQDTIDPATKARGGAVDAFRRRPVSAPQPIAKITQGAATCAAANSGELSAACCRLAKHGREDQNCGDSAFNHRSAGGSRDSLVLQINCTVTVIPVISMKDAPRVDDDRLAGHGLGAAHGDHHVGAVVLVGRRP
jgi:hypothetical protein